MSNNPRAKRLVMYSWWGFNTALSIAFAALSCTNAGNLRHVGWVKTCDDTCRRVGDTQKKAVIIASVLGTCMVLLYSLVSFMLLLSNMISSTLVSRFWYGVLMSSSLHVSLFMLLSASVLQIFKFVIDISGELSSQLKDVFKVCLGLCYILVATYLIQFFMYWLWQRAFTDEASSSAATSGSTNPVGVPVREKKPPSKAAKRDQKAIEFNRALQGGAYNTMVV